jgi:hypothetical protein
VEAEEAQDPQGVLADAGRGVADEAHPPGFEVRKTTDGVVQPAVRTERERVYGEVAPLGIAGEIVTEPDDGVAPVGLDILAQGGDLDRSVLGDERDGAVLDSGGNRLQPRRAPRGGDHFFGQQRRREIDIG